MPRNGLRVGPARALTPVEEKEAVMSGWNLHVCLLVGYGTIAGIDWDKQIDNRAAAQRALIEQRAKAHGG